MIRVTVDTNVIGIALKSGSDFRKCVESGIISAYIAETSLTIDGLSRNDKINLLSLREAQHQFKQSRWDDYINTGVTFLLCQRIGLSRPIGKDSKGNDFKYTLRYKALDHTYDQTERENRYYKALRYIQNELNSGQAWLKGLSEEIQKSGGQYDNKKPWHQNLIENIKYVGKSQVFKRFGDWADADALAAHYAYGNDIFYTNDKASGAGSHSILSFENRARLRERFNIKFASPEDMQKLINKISG